MKFTSIISAVIGTLLITATPVIANRGGPCLPCSEDIKGQKMCGNNHMTTWVQICDGKCWQTFEDCKRSKHCVEKPEPHCVKG